MNQELEKELKALKADMIIFKEMIRETSRSIRDQKFSSYPIFIAHTTAVALGQQILDNKELGTSFGISASTLEEFTEKGLIEKNKINDFKQTYRDPSEFMCVFLIFGLNASFIFLPYKSEESKNKKA